MVENKNTLYKEVADRIISLIDLGALKKGEKIPSIRNLSDQLSVSINTVKEAYNYLEDNYYIEAISQSGYYVLSPVKNKKEVGQTDPKNFDPQNVSLCRIYSAFLNHGQGPPGVELGVATLGNELWPINKLNQCCNEVLRYKYKEAYNYCMPPGNDTLREQISIFSLKSETVIDPDDIIITSGCTQSIYLALSTICKPGDTVAVQSPTYFNFFDLCEKLKLKIIEIPGSLEEGINIETLKFVLDNYSIKALYTIPNFNNPTGCCMSDDNKELLTEVMGGYDVPIIEDDVFGELHFNKRRPTTCKSFDKTGNVILCSSFSKILAPGLRVGWIVPGKYYNQIEKLKTLCDLGASTLPQIVIASFLKKGGFNTHLKTIRNTLSKQMSHMRESVLKNFPIGTRVTEPEGGFVLWIELPEHIDSLELYNIVLEKEIMIAPGPLFSMTGKYSNFIRLNTGTWNNNIKNAIEYIGDILKKIK